MTIMMYIYDATTIIRRRKIAIQSYQRLYVIILYHAICNLENA